MVSERTMSRKENKGKGSRSGPERELPWRDLTGVQRSILSLFYFFGYLSGLHLRTMDFSAVICPFS